MDEWDDFPDAQQASAQDEWGEFPDAPKARSGRSMDVMADGSLKPTSEVTYGPEGIDQWMQAGKNVAEGIGQAATGVTGAIAGDVAGLGALAYDISANALLNPLHGQPGSFADPSKVREWVQSRLTYQPSDPNNLTSKIVQYPGQVMSGAGEFMASKVENPYLQNVLRAVPQAAASYAGVRAATPLKSAQGVAIPREGVPKQAPKATPEQVAIKQATDAGYRLSPTQVGNKVGGAAEGLSGQAALERTLSHKNVPITDNLAKKAVGIADDKPLTPATIGIEKTKANRAYDAVARTGVRKTSDEYRAEIAGIDDRTGAGSFAEDVPASVVNLKKYYESRPAFDAKDAVAKVRQLRKDGRANIKTRDPEKSALGDAQLKIAEALDNELVRHAESLGQPQLAANYKAARVQLAKLHTVEDALSGTNVSAKKIWQQWKRGAPLQGELLTIARTYDSFQHVLQEAGKIRAKHPFSVVDAFVAAGGAAVHPGLLATVAARPLTRAALASKTYQRNFVAPKGQSAPKQKAVAPKPAASSAALIRDDPKRRSR